MTNLGSGNYDIIYDPAVFEVTDITSGLIDGTTMPVHMWQAVAPGTARVIQSATGLSGVSGSGYVAEIHLHVIGSGGNTSAISFSNGILRDSAVNQIPASWSGGSVIVYKVGDANGDGIVNALDITKVKRIIIGIDSYIPGADANLDGNVNELDITRIELIMLGR